MKPRIIQLIIKAFGYVGVPLATAEAEQLTGIIIGIAVFAIDIVLHKVQKNDGD